MLTFRDGSAMSSTALSSIPHNNNPIQPLPEICTAHGSMQRNKFLEKATTQQPHFFIGIQAGRKGGMKAGRQGCSSWPEYLGRRFGSSC